MYFCKITKIRKIEIYFVRRIIRFCYATMPQKLIVSLGTDGYPYHISFARADNAAAYYVVDGDTDAERISNLIMACVKLGMVDDAFNVIKTTGVEKVSHKAFNSLIVACVTANRGDDVMELCGMM